MAETREYVRTELSSCQHTETTELHPVAVTAPKDQHSDYLHKFLQKAALHSYKNSSSSHSDMSRTHQNLFLEGFRDCASEVIRFLTEDEHVEDNSPLLMGLHSHLLNVSNTICHETISDLDRHDAELEKQKYAELLSTTIDNAHINNGTFISHISPFSPSLTSPNDSRSANSSVSDTSATESDISMSLASEKSHESVSSDINSSSHNASIEIQNDNLIDHIKGDDVFHSPSSHLQYPTSNTVLPFPHLSVDALQATDCPGQKATDLQETLSNELLLPLTCVESGSCNSSTPAISLQYLPSLNHSSPLPKSSTQSTSSLGDSCHLSQCLCTISRSETSNIPHFSAVSSWNESMSINSDPFVPNSLLPQQRHFLPMNVQTHEQRVHNLLPFNLQKSDESQTHSDLLQQMNSILELKASCVPGIETTSLASENFADVLLAVESCRFHEDPRVRTLAEELVHLIHDDEFDDDEEDFDYDHTDEEEENMYNINGEIGIESGIEMSDESADWNNAVDMIEQ